MAKRNFSRRTRGRVQLKSAVKKKSSKTIAVLGAKARRPILLAGTEARFVPLRLRYLRSVILTAAVALSSQNADYDDDISRTLIFGVANPLLDEIEKLEKILGKEAPHE